MGTGCGRSWLSPHLRRRAVAAVLAATAVLLAIGSVGGAGRPTETVRVALAARDLAPGTRLVAGDLRLIDLPAEAVPASAAPSVSALVGKVLADGVRAREPLTDLRLAGRGAPSDLEPGQVAAPVRLADPGLAPLVHTGMTVDVLAAPDSPTGPADSSTAPARVVARAARVLTVASATTTPDATGGTLAPIFAQGC